MRRIGVSRIALLVGVSLVISVVAGQAAPAATAVAAPTLITVADYLGAIVIAGSNLAYMSNGNQRRIEVLDIGTGTLDAPIAVASAPGAIDLSPDGTLLYVANREANDVSVIDLAQRSEVRRYPLGASPTALGVAANGTALALVRKQDGYMTVQQIDLVTGAVRDRGPITLGPYGAVSIDAQFMKSSPDHSRILLFGGAAAMYTAATDSFSQPTSFGLNAASAGLDRSGSTVVMEPGILLDAQLSMQASIPPNDQSYADGLAVDAPGGTAYRAHRSTVEVLDLVLHRVTATIAVPEPVLFGHMALTADDATLVYLSRSGIVIAPVSTAVAVPTCTPVSPAPTVVGVCGRLADVKVSADGHAYASNPAFDQVEVLSLATGHLEAPIPVGSQPRGLDLSPDGRTLYVADWGAYEVSVVDTAQRREVRRIPVPAHAMPYRDGPIGIAVAGNGTALLTTSYEGEIAESRILQLDLVHETVVPRPEWEELFGRSGPPSALRASADHSLIAAGITGSSNGVAGLYTSATDSFGPWAPVLGSGSVAAAAGGSRVLVVPGSAVFDAGMVQQAVIGGDAVALAVDPTGTKGYRVHETTVDVLDLDGAVASGSIALPEPVGAGRGTIDLSPDGTRLVVLTASGISTLGTGLTPKSAYAVWKQPTTAGLDALGMWVAPGTVPAAAGGQLAPSYLYAHYFNFTQSPSALGVIGLVTSAGAKLAAFGVVDGAGDPHSVGLRYEWVAGRAYYLLAVQLAPSSFGGWVYDYTAAAWTSVGRVDLPTPPGKISPATITQVIWFGPTAGTCSAYPQADAYFYPAVGYAGGGMAQATMADSRATASGTCSAAATTEPAPWTHLHLGADLS